jgi:hypothetical protein
MRPFFAAVVAGVLPCTAACGPLQQTASDPLKFSSAQHFLHTDKVKMFLDLQRELRDANGTHGLSPCDNLTENVNVEVARMDNFASGTVIDDVAATQNDVSALRAERADFKRDINDFVNDGVPRPAEERSTIAAITGMIRHAVGNANNAIKAIRRELRRAHSSAASHATGECVHDAPASAPTIPLVH